MENNYQDVFLARLHEIETCLDNRCYLAALALALTVPDICGKAEYPLAGNGKRYRDWYQEHIGKYEIVEDEHFSGMPYLSGDLLYQLRNSFLHSGNPNVDANDIHNEQCKVDRFALWYGTSPMGGMSSKLECPNGKTQKEYIMSITVFCRKIVAVARAYYEENKGKFDFFKYELIEKNTRVFSEEEKQKHLQLLYETVAQMQNEEPKE